MGGYNGRGQLGYLRATQMTLPTFKSLMEQMLATGCSRGVPHRRNPTYKKDSEWKFSKTKSPEGAPPRTPR